MKHHFSRHRNLVQPGHWEASWQILQWTLDDLGKSPMTKCMKKWYFTELYRKSLVFLPKWSSVLVKAVWFSINIPRRDMGYRGP